MPVTEYPGDATVRTASVARKVRSNRDSHVDHAALVLAKAGPDGVLSDADYPQFRSHIEAARRFNDALDVLDQVQTDRHDVWVRSEPRTYGPDSPHSFFVDQADAVRTWAPDHEAAKERIRRHGSEVCGAVAAGGADGKRYLRAAHDLNRGALDRGSADRQIRAMTTDPESAGSFATPAYLMDLWTKFRSPNGSFADQCTPAPLPPYGMTINVPAFTSSTGVGAQTAENVGVDEADPTSDYLSTSLTTIAGAVPVATQLFDRGGAPGAGFDQILLAQMSEQLRSQVDQLALVTALANAPTVDDSSAFSISGLYTDLSSGRESLTDTEGTRLPGTHLFTTSDLWGHISSQVDDSHRPIVTPHFTAQPWAALSAGGDPKGLGWTGHVFPGGLAAFTDDNIPAIGSNTQLVVARPSTVLLFEGDPISIVFPETHSTTLSVEVGLRCYVGVIPTYAAAVCSISGDAYPTSLK